MSVRDLQRAMSRYRGAQGDLGAARSALAASIRRARAAGMTVAAIMDITGLARQTVYDALREESGR